MGTNNTDVVLRYWYQELWDNWNIAAADDLLTDDYRLHAPGVPVPLDRETTKQVVAMYGNAFPDLKHTVDEVICETWLSFDSAMVLQQIGAVPAVANA